MKSYPQLLTACLLLIYAYTLPAVAQNSAYKCMIDGQPTIQDMPCPSNANTQKAIHSGPAIPICTASIDPLIQQPPVSGEKFKTTFWDDIRRICPGATLAANGSITVQTIDGDTHVFRPDTNDETGRDDSLIYKMQESFNADGFKWKVLSARRYPQLGEPNNPQKPDSGSFVAIELQLINMTDQPRLFSSFTLFANNIPYDESPKTMFASKQFGYPPRTSTTIEPGETSKTYVVFDAGFTSEYILLIRERDDLHIGQNRKKADGKVKIVPL